MFKELLQLSSLMRQASSIGERMQETTAQLRQHRVTGSTGSGASGGALIEVEANGVGEVLSVRIAPELLAQRDLSTIEQLLPVAVNDALSRARQTQMSQMQSLGEGLNLPGLQEALARVQGGPS
ncbi:MAG: hypothetical protein RIS70_3178 [Planctomycetota bacterium]